MKLYLEKPLLLIIVFVCVLFNYVNAQDTTSHFAVNILGSVYVQQEDKSSNYSIYPVPEIEVLYKLQTFKKLSAYTGLKYMYNHWHKEAGVKSEWRRKTHELAIPLILEQSIGNYLMIKGGVDIGYLLKGKMEYRNNIPAHPEWEDVTYQTDYDESSRFYLGLHLDCRLKYELDSWNIISIGPTFSYKLKDNWMNEVRPRSMFGIKLQYSFRF